MPSGFDRDGLPLMFQIAGRLHDEATVFRVAQAYAQEPIGTRGGQVSNQLSQKNLKLRRALAV